MHCSCTVHVADKGLQILNDSTGVLINYVKSHLVLSSEDKPR